MYTVSASNHKHFEVYLVQNKVESELSTYKSASLVRLEKLEGIGPWKEFPWNLLKEYSHN